MRELDWVTPYKNLLFTVTGGTPYYLVGDVLRRILFKFCPEVADPSVMNHSSVCSVIFYVAVIAGLAIAPVAFGEWYKIGKWFWTDCLHVFADA